MPTLPSMDQTYYILIKAGRRTIESIPAQHQAAVQALLDADNEQEAPSS